jgi:hypothetical protein
MATHLSESSVNSLLRFINQADTSASYNEKVDLLKKSGILEKDQQYSSVVNKSRIEVEVPYNELSLGTGVAESLTSLADIVEAAKKAYIAAGYGTTPDFADEATDLLTGGQGVDGADVSNFSSAWAITVRDLMELNTDQASSYSLAWNGVQAATTPLLFRNATELSLTGAQTDIKTKISATLDRIKKLGIDPTHIANYTSDKLTAFFVDGTYNFTYILFPTTLLPNGATGTGTSVISSNYDSYTKLLDKKAMINTFFTQPPQPSQTALQSFDITSTFMVMETYGSSLVGKFRIDGNKLQIKDYGFDATTGTFTNFQSVYQKTEIGYVVSNYNTDTDQLHSVWYYSIVPSPAMGALPGKPNE